MHFFLIALCIDSTLWEITRWTILEDTRIGLETIDCPHNKAVKKEQEEHGAKE